MARGARGRSPRSTRVASRVRPRGGSLDPTLAWAYAGPRRAQALARGAHAGRHARAAREHARAAARAGRRRRRGVARAGPAAPRADPVGGAAELAAGLVASADGSFVADGGQGAARRRRSRRGSAFDSAAAAALRGRRRGRVARAVRAITLDRAIELTGGTRSRARPRRCSSATSRSAARSRSSSRRSCSSVTFRRARALVAVLPPLVAGTVWTTGLAAFVSPGLTAIAIGVHGGGRRRGRRHGRPRVRGAPRRAARRGSAPRGGRARRARRTWRPTLLAALAAGLAFASLALERASGRSGSSACCAAFGEVLTAVAILWMTPDIGALLERGAALPPPLRPCWLRGVARITRTRRGAWGALGRRSLVVVAVAVARVAEGGRRGRRAPPARARAARGAGRDLPALRGRRGQWIVLAERRARAQRAAARGDRSRRRSTRSRGDGTIDGFDALTSYRAGARTQVARLASATRSTCRRSRRGLEAALADAGFDAGACAPALGRFAAPRPCASRRMRRPDAATSAGSSRGTVAVDDAAAPSSRSTCARARGPPRSARGRRDPRGRPRQRSSPGSPTSRSP